MALVGVVGALVSPLAGAGAQADSVTVVVTVDETVVDISLAQVTEPIGALEIEVDGLPPLRAPCVLQSGLETCSEIEGGAVRIVALNTSGWTTDTTLVTAEFTAPPAGPVGVVVPVLTDLNGSDLPVSIVAPAAPPVAADGDGSGPLRFRS